jgi:hypothetical protein
MTYCLYKHFILISLIDLRLSLINNILNLLLILLGLYFLKLLKILIHHTPPPIFRLLLDNKNLKLYFGHKPFHFLLTTDTADHEPILPENSKPVFNRPTILVAFHITVLIQLKFLYVFESFLMRYYFVRY